MKQELIDIVFTSLVVFLFFSLSLSFSLSLLLISFGWKGWLLRGGLAKLSQLKLWHHFEQGRLGKVPSVMVLLLAFLYMCLSFAAGVERLSHSEHEAKALWHWFHFFGCLSLSPLVVTWANGFVVVCCCWGGRVVVLCTCLLLPGCKVWLRLFSEGWAPVPPLPSLLSLLLLGGSLSICSWGGSEWSSANLGPRWAKYHQKIMFFPFARCVLHLVSVFSM